MIGYVRIDIDGDVSDYPKGAPIPNKGDEVMFNANYGIVDRIVHVITPVAYETTIYVK